MIILNFGRIDGYVNMHDPTLEQYKAALDQLSSDLPRSVQLVLPNSVIMVSISDNNERTRVLYSRYNPSGALEEELCAIDGTLTEHDLSKRVEFTMSNGEAHNVAFYKTVPRDVGIQIGLWFFTHQSPPEWVIWKPVLAL